MAGTGRSDRPATTDVGEEVDVVVLGFGAAGCAAAIEAHDAGARVVVLEKMPAGLEGGNTRVSGGVWFDNRDPERMAEYLRALCGDFPIPEAVVEVWAHETARNTEWMERAVGATVASVGDVPPEYPELPGSNAYGGYIGVDGTMGSGKLFGALSKAVRERGIEVRTGTSARELIATSDGVTGVVADSADGPVRIGARGGVVLATGGFENNPQMVRDYLGLPEPVVWGSPGSTGDGHRMAQRVGADLWHMGNMMTVLGLRAPGYECGFYIAFFSATGFVYVGLDGSRFTNELPQLGHGQAHQHGRYELFPLHAMHVVFDERTRRAGPLSPVGDYPIGWNILVEGYEWSDDNSAEVARGWFHRADTIAELAGLLDVDPTTLEASIARYNTACEHGCDEQFGRDPATLTPVVEPPFYGFTWAPMLAWTNGGPRRDERAQVLDAAGEVIPGLYAAGNVSSTYSWCKDGGFHIADALVFGRIAGREAASRR